VLEKSGEKRSELLTGIGEQWREEKRTYYILVGFSKSFKKTENLSPRYKILTFFISC